MALGPTKNPDLCSRRSFIGGSDARIIMGNDEAALVRLWREKRGEADPPDLSSNLIVQLGTATEEAQSHVVRAQYRPQHRRRPAPGPAFNHPVDGGNPRRHRTGEGSRLRSEVHVVRVRFGCA